MESPLDAAKAMQQRRDQRAGVCARAGMDDHSGWLIDDGDVFVFVENIQRNIFRFDARRAGGRNFDD